MRTTLTITLFLGLLIMTFGCKKPEKRLGKRNTAWSISLYTHNYIEDSTGAQKSETEGIDYLYLKFNKKNQVEVYGKFNAQLDLKYDCWAKTLVEQGKVKIGEDFIFTSSYIIGDYREGNFSIGTYNFGYTNLDKETFYFSESHNYQAYSPNSGNYIATVNTGYTMKSIDDDILPQ